MESGCNSSLFLFIIPVCVDDGTNLDFNILFVVLFYRKFEISYVKQCTVFNSCWIVIEIIMEAYICIYLKICKTMIFCLHIFLRKLQMLAITVLFSSHLVSFTNKKHMAVLLYSISCISIQYAFVS